MRWASTDAVLWKQGVAFNMSTAFPALNLPPATERFNRRKLGHKEWCHQHMRQRQAMVPGLQQPEGLLGETSLRLDL